MRKSMERRIGQRNERRKRKEELRPYNGSGRTARPERPRECMHNAPHKKHQHTKATKLASMPQLHPYSSHSHFHFQSHTSKQIPTCSNKMQLGAFCAFALRASNGRSLDLLNWTFRGPHHKMAWFENKKKYKGCKRHKPPRKSTLITQFDVCY
jgi:hypothetical protein